MAHKRKKVLNMQEFMNKDYRSMNPSEFDEMVKERSEELYAKYVAAWDKAANIENMCVYFSKDASVDAYLSLRGFIKYSIGEFNILENTPEEYHLKRMAYMWARMMDGKYDRLANREWIYGADKMSLEDIRSRKLYSGEGEQ